MSARNLDGCIHHEVLPSLYCSSLRRTLVYLPAADGDLSPERFGELATPEITGGALDIRTEEDERAGWVVARAGCSRDGRMDQSREGHESNGILRAQPWPEPRL